MYEVLNAIAHICMIILVLEVFALLVVPALGIGLGGVLGLRFARRRLSGPISFARALPRRAYRLVNGGCNAVAWPVIQGTSVWRGTKVALASLRRQAGWS